MLFAVPCEWEWSPYGECSKTCGGGRQRRVPVITREAMHDGFCPDFVVNREPEERDCNTMECPSKCPTPCSILHPNWDSQL